MAAKNSEQQVGIVGSGLIGHSFAMIYAASGYRVRIYDIKPEQVQHALSTIDEQLEHLAKNGLLRGKLTVKEQRSLITGTNDLAECVKDAFFIQECVYEDLDLKRGVHGKIDGLCKDGVIIASSASALIPSLISQNLKHKNRFIVCHPTNPPFYAPLVEVIPAPWTDPDVVVTTKQLLAETGQVPVIVKKEIDGFVLNRIQYSIIGECWRLYEEGVMSVEDIDKVMSEGLGRRYAFMGPLETAYLNADGMYNYGDKYREMIYRVQCTFGAPRKMEGPTLDKIQNELTSRIPLDQLNERRKWRDIRLASLQKLKNDLDKK
ncbi:lambda-crystallin-like [Crassostrea angulata]|uniref:lambda-crystallin-like n=1 Tax=Magallana angulata TaxID=2784310 RepID=UPI0022B0F6C7|nr:lambda-crystallin-like [Crassostrea angulata]XP_052711238.1 lambda-crystallin-like [Crassostrea angulata]XP_052711239.1 lambda-crystallin-like [Crassostrea angulata]